MAVVVVILMIASPFILPGSAGIWLANGMNSAREWRILHLTNHRALLAACRDLIREERRHLPADDPHRTIGGDDAALPPAIRSLAPSYIVVNQDSVIIVFGGGFLPGGVVRGYADDVTKEGGGKMMLPGLWYSAVNNYEAFL